MGKGLQKWREARVKSCMQYKEYQQDSLFLSKPFCSDSEQTRPASGLLIEQYYTIKPQPKYRTPLQKQQQHNLNIEQHYYTTKALSESIQ